MTITKTHTLTMNNTPAYIQLEDFAELQHHKNSDKHDHDIEQIRYAFDKSMQSNQTEEALAIPQKKFVDRRKRSPNVNPFNKGMSALGDRRKPKMISTNKSFLTITEGVID